ncbi:MAG TPA: preprotein translocase subunit SecE [Patescibacteria group bacterium]|nr:preprotein translocase subunit SecE [Patescibacteria group bacterium]
MFKNLVGYIKDSRAELRKVVWPTKKQTKNHTLMVIAISLAVAFFLGAVDYVLNKILEIFVY